MFPSETTNVRSTCAGVGARPGHGRDLRLEKALCLVILDQLLPVFIEHVAVILAEEARGSASACRSWSATGPPRRNGCPRSSMLLTLTLGPSKISITILVSPVLPPSSSVTEARS